MIQEQKTVNRIIFVHGLGKVIISSLKNELICTEYFEKMIFFIREKFK